MNRFGSSIKISFVFALVLIAMMSFSFVHSQDTTAEPENSMPLTQEFADKFAKRFDEIFIGPNIDIADEIFASNFVGHAPLAPKLDRDGWKAYVTNLYGSISDLHEEVNQVIVSEDRVVLHVTYTGTQDGALFGTPATGKKISFEGIGIFSFDKEGHVTENWAVLDVVALLAEIGAFPPAAK
jgi:predicted ester cyclase